MESLKYSKTEKYLKHILGKLKKASGIRLERLCQVKIKENVLEKKKKNVTFLLLLCVDLAINKKTYLGDRFFAPGDYDYIFDVEDDSDIQKSIPFNEGDNPMEAAEKYCARESNKDEKKERKRKVILYPLFDHESDRYKQGEC